MWKFLRCSEQQIKLKIVLDCGQSFRWSQKVDDPSVWLGVLDKKLWFLRQNSDGIEYKVFDKTTVPVDDNNSGTFAVNNLNNNHVENEKFLRDYFQLDIDIPSLYEKWSSADKNFKGLQNQFCGIRMLRQDPVENLFSFICSQNNNIVRIKQLVNKLCITYGHKAVCYQDVDYYSFPSMSALAQPGVEKKLRELGFGYRAKFIQGTASCIDQKEEGEEWLYNLRNVPYNEAHQGKRFILSKGFSTILFPAFPNHTSPLSLTNIGLTLCCCLYTKNIILNPKTLIKSIFNACYMPVS